MVMVGESLLGSCLEDQETSKFSNWCSTSNKEFGLEFCSKKGPNKSTCFDTEENLGTDLSCKHPIRYQRISKLIHFGFFVQNATIIDSNLGPGKRDFSF